MAKEFSVRYEGLLGVFTSPAHLPLFELCIVTILFVRQEHTTTDSTETSTVYALLLWHCPGYLGNTSRYQNDSVIIAFRPIVYFDWIEYLSDRNLGFLIAQRKALSWDMQTTKVDAYATLNVRS